MRTLFRIATAALLVLGLLTTSSPVLARRASSPPIPVTKCGQVLDVEGGEYALAPGLLNCYCGLPNGPPAVVTITASKIHLNTAGGGINTICTAVAISDGVSDILIDGGGNLEGGGGLVIGTARHIEVKGVRLFGESDLGGSQAGVQINGARDVTVTGCQIFGALSIGVQLNKANNVKVMENTIDASLGIYGTANNSVFSNNNVFESSEGGGAGIFLMGRGNFVAHNSMVLQTFSPGLNNRDVGIVVTDHNRVLRNIINQFYFGVELSGDSNSVVGNIITVPLAGFTAVGKNGIETDPGAMHNSISSNLVNGNQADLFESNGPPCVNVWRKNFFQTSGGGVACIH